MGSASNKSLEVRKPKPTSIIRALFGLVLGLLIALTLVWLFLGDRVYYAASECSKGGRQCAIAVAVALGAVEVYDKNGRCIGTGCF